MIALFAFAASLVGPGNVHFDPLNLAKYDPKVGGASYLAAERKHGRLAMLASTAWPLQEYLHPGLAKAANAPSKLSEGLSPSLVNGGLQPSVLYLFLGAASIIELMGISYHRKRGTVNDGDYGWRMTVHDADSKRFRLLANGEAWNGRIAMLAIVAYVAWEALTKQPLVAALGS